MTNKIYPYQIFTEIEGEEWKPIVGYLGFFVSNFGRIRSPKGKIMKQQVHYKSKKFKSEKETPYLKIQVKNNGKPKTITVHRLVAIGFHDNPENLRQVHHLDDDKFNNNASNLKWCDNSFNQKEAFKSGLQVPRVGETNNKAVLNKEQVIQIRQDYQSGKYTLHKLAGKFGVSWQNIHAIRFT